VKGYVSTGMEGMKDTVLGPGGFAMMPSKAPHWFTCTAKEECLMFELSTAPTTSSGSSPASSSGAWTAAQL